MRTGSGVPVWSRGFPFFLAEPRSAVERLRSTGSRQVWGQRPLWKRLALGGAMTISWPIATFIDAVKISARRAKEGRGRFLSCFGAFYAEALRRNVAPRHYAYFESSLGIQSTELSDFLLPLDLRALQRLSMSRGAVLRDVQDKARFAQICVAHALPCVPTLAVFDHGASTGEEVLRGWTQPLFVKALTGNKGAGAELWRPSGRGFVSSGGEDLTTDELIEALRPQNCIVQPALEDHPLLKAIGTLAVSSVRIITARGGAIQATPIGATLSLAVEPGVLTGRFGVQCGVDLDDGTITKTTTPIDEDVRLMDRNLIGFALPDWSTCMSLARRAHDEAFPAFATLGWDLALTSAGPVLLETNLGWGMMGHQKLSGPLGKTALADVIDELLAPADAGRPSANRPSKQVARSRPPAPRGDRGPAGAAGRTRRRRATKAS